MRQSAIRVETDGDQATAAARYAASGAGSNGVGRVPVRGGKPRQRVGPQDLDPPLARQPEKAAIPEKRESPADGLDRQPEIVGDILPLHRQIEHARRSEGAERAESMVKNQASRSSAELRPIIIM